MINSSKKRIEWLDILRGIGIILMVFGHICYSGNSYRWIYSFHMAIFFFAAGFVYKKKNVWEDILHRAYTILIPYFAYGLLTLIYWYFVERHFKDIGISFMQGFTGLLKGQYETLQFNIPLWFLPCFFITMVTYNIISNLSNKKLGYTFITVLTIIYIFVPFKPMLWGIDKIFKYILFVMLGEAASHLNITDKLNLSVIKQVIVTIILFAASIFTSGRLTQTRGIWFITATIGCMACIFLSMLISNRHILKTSIQQIGRAAMIILCLHGPVYRAIIGTITHFGRIGMIAIRANYLYSGIITIATIGIIYLIFLLIKRIQSE